MTLSTTLSTLWSWPALLAVLTVVFVLIRRKKDDDGNIPWATGAIPLLGHALAYKRDPAGFITEQRKLVGDVFRLNLAGKRMIVVAGGAENVKAVAFASERRFSARAAVRDVGFGELLGERNVDAGTDFHARVLRRWRLDDAEIAELAVALDEGLDAELTGKEVPDLLAAIRGAVLRAVLSRLIGGGILEHGGSELVDSIVEFQDGVEEATAAAAVLPRWLALPLILWPAARRRRRLEKRISAALEGGDGARGPWATAFGERKLPAAIAAEFSVGLLFAAHKNPAIASFQALLFLHERRLPAALHACVNTVDSFQEALVVARDPSASTLREAQQLCRVALEAIRLTAHTVGAVRLATEDCALPGNRVVKKGETVALSHIAFSRDEALWGPDAAKFSTAREAYAGPVAFDSRGSADDVAYSAFSQGTHKCPGERVALVIVQTTLALLVARGVRPVKVPPLCFERATLAQRAAPVRAIVSVV